MRTGVNNQPASNVNGSFGVYLNPAGLSGLPNQFGNFTADPAFIAPRDPRPNGDTPAVFFRYANFDLTSRSPAINLATNAYAPATDILYRLPVAIAGRSVNGSGPASIGAFYYLGIGGITPTSGTTFTDTTTTTTIVAALTSGLPTSASNSIVGGSLPLGTQFGVVNSSLNPDGVSSGKPGIATSISAPTTVTINFSDYVDPTTVQPTDLVVSGSGVNSINPAKATGLTWVDSHTVKFLLAGGFNTSGAVNLSIAEGAIKDRRGDSLAAYAEAFVLDSLSNLSTGTDLPVATTVPATSVAASAAPVQPVVSAVAAVAVPIQPVALAGPIAVSYTKSGLAKTHLTKAAAAAAKKAEAAKVHAAKVLAAKQAAAAKHAVKQAAASHAVAQTNAKHGKATK